MVKASVLAVLLLPALVLAAAPAPRIERPVTDTVGLLSPEAVESVATELVRLREDTGVQLAMLVVGTTAPEPLEDFSMRVVEAWRGGGAGRDDGLLFTLAVNDRRMRLEVGYGLEETLPDDAVRRLLDAQIPFIKEKRYRDALLGVIAGVRERVTGRVEPRASEPAQAPVAQPVETRREAPPGGREQVNPWPGGDARGKGVPVVSNDSGFFVGRSGFVVLCVLGGLMGTVLGFLWTRWLKESGLARVGITGALVFGVPWVVTLLGEGAPYPVSHFVWVLLLMAGVACLATYIYLEASRSAALFIAGVPGLGIVFALLMFENDVRPFDLLGDVVMVSCGVGFAMFFVLRVFDGGNSSRSYSSRSYSSSDGSSSASASDRTSFFSVSSSASDSSWFSSSSSDASDSSWSSSSSDSSSSSSSDDYSGGGGDFGGGGASSSW